jgi:hypothetical protein
MKLHEETTRRIQELFAEKHCHRCRQPARRIRKQQFYCDDCFTNVRRLELRTHRHETPHAGRF